MMFTRREYFTFFLIISLALHTFLFLPIPIVQIAPLSSESEGQNKLSQVNLQSLKFIKHKGSMDSLEKEGKDQENLRRQSHASTPTELGQQTLPGVRGQHGVTAPSSGKRKLKLSDLSQDFNPKRPSAKALVKKSEKKFQTVTSQQVKQYIADAPSKISASDMMKMIGNTDMSVSFGIPDGMEEDQYNQAEMVFYGFRRRLAMAYISAFFDKVNEYNLKNPHMQFPMTRDEEVMTSMVTYDQEGNILRVRMVRWTEKQRLQDFFVEVMESMGSLPNPPTQIIQDGEFTVFYTLNIKN